MEKKITARESVIIDKELAEIPKIIDKHDTYFYAADQVKELEEMRDEIADIFDKILNRIIP